MSAGRCSTCGHALEARCASCGYWLVCGSLSEPCTEDGCADTRLVPENHDEADVDRSAQMIREGRGWDGMLVEEPRRA